MPPTIICINGEGGRKGTLFPCHILLINTQTSEGPVLTSPPCKASEVTAAGSSDAAQAPLRGTLAGADTQDHLDPPASDVCTLSCLGTQAFHHDCTHYILGACLGGKEASPTSLWVFWGQQVGLFFLFMNCLACSGPWEWLSEWMNDVPLSIFKVLNFILDEHTYFRDCKKKEEKKDMYDTGQIL